MISFTVEKRLINVIGRGGVQTNCLCNVVWCVYKRQVILPDDFEVQE